MKKMMLLAGMLLTFVGCGNENNKKVVDTNTNSKNGNFTNISGLSLKNGILEMQNTPFTGSIIVADGEPILYEISKGKIEAQYSINKNLERHGIAIKYYENEDGSITQEKEYYLEDSWVDEDDFKEYLEEQEILQTPANLSTLIRDLAAYYTSQGGFSADIDKMTNVKLYSLDGKVNNKSNSNFMYLKVGKESFCFNIQLGNLDGSKFTPASSINKDAKIALSESIAIKVSAVSINDKDNLCEEIFALPATKNLMESENIEVGTEHIVRVGSRAVKYEY